MMAFVLDKNEDIEGQAASEGVAYAICAANGACIGTPYRTM